MSDTRYARGYRRMQPDLSVTLGGTQFFPSTPAERERVLDYVGDGHRVYCVEVPAGVLIAPVAGDADGHAVIMTGVRSTPLDTRLL